MAAQDIIIRLVAQGAQQVAQSIGGAGQSVERLGTQTGDAASGARQLDSALDGLQSSGRGAGEGLEDAARGAGDLAEGAGQAEQQTNGLQQTLEKTRNAGLVMTGIGVAGLAITQKMIDAHKEGDGLEKKLESLLKTQGRLDDLDGINDVVGKVTTEGHLDDDDSIREAAIHLASFSVQTKDLGALLPRVARQVRTGFGDMASVADGLGKAYSALDLGPLKKSGLVFTDSEEAALKYAKSLGEVEGRAKFVEIVTQGIDRNTVELGDSLTDAEAAANDLTNAMDGAMTTMGAGAGDAQAQVNGVLASIVNVANGAPQLEYAAGYLGYFVSGGMTVVGSLLTVGSQIGMTAMGFSSMGLTSVAAFRSMATSALAAGPAIWAAMAPLLPLILAIAAAAIVTTAALYVLSGAKDAMDQAAKDEEQANGADKEFFQKQTARRKEGKSSDVLEGETIEQWRKRKGRGQENSETDGADKGASAMPDMSGIQAQLSSIQAGNMSAPAMPSMPAMPQVSEAPVATLPVIGAPVTAQLSTSIGAPVGKSRSKAPTGGDPFSGALNLAQSGMFLSGVDLGSGRRVETGAGGGAATKGKTTKGGRIEVPVHSEVGHDAGGDWIIHFVVDDVKIPYQGIGQLKGKVKRG